MSKSLVQDIFNIVIRDQHLILMTDKTMYWVEEKMLIVSDLHIGKVMHFRKFGYAVPLESIQQNYQRLSDKLKEMEIQTCLFLGDLFHSTENSETDIFWKVISQYSDIEFILVKGNHDVHSTKYFIQKGLTVYDKYILKPFSFTHEPLEEVSSHYNLSGHIHPSIKLRGKGRSFLKLPCFFFTKHQGIVPSFGVFTGTHSIKAKKGDRVVAILEGKSLMEIDI